MKKYRDKKCLRCEKPISAGEKIWVNDDGDYAHDDCIGFDDLKEWKSYNFDYYEY